MIFPNNNNISWLIQTMRFKKNPFNLFIFLLFLCLTSFSVKAKELPTRSFCIFDPIGEKGPAYVGLQGSRVRMGSFT
jgi:hypothetical protein